jgi:transposase
VVYSQTQRWINAQIFEAIAHDLLREEQDKSAAPRAVVFDSRTLQSTPESGHRAGVNVHKARKGTKVHVAVDTLGHLLALCVTPANEGDRSQVEALCNAVQEVTGHQVEVAYVDGGYAGKETEKEAARHKVKLQVVKVQEAKKGFVLVPKCWVVERSFAWATRFRRLAKDYEQLPETVKSLHILVPLLLSCSLLLPPKSSTRSKRRTSAQPHRHNQRSSRPCVESRWTERIAHAAKCRTACSNISSCSAGMFSGVKVQNRLEASSTVTSMATAGSSRSGLPPCRGCVVSKYAPQSRYRLKLTVVIQQRERLTCRR